VLGPADGAFEDEGVLDLCHCLAWAAASDFGQVGDQGLMALKDRAESNLELLAAPPRTKRVLGIEAGLQPARRAGYYNGT
jgi:hypothetical protein